MNKRNKRFNIALYEATFAATLKSAFTQKRVVNGALDPAKLRALEADREFSAAALQGTTRTSNVERRLSRAEVIVGSL